MKKPAQIKTCRAYLKPPYCGRERSRRGAPSGNMAVTVSAQTSASGKAGGVADQCPVQLPVLHRAEQPVVVAGIVEEHVGGAAVGEVRDPGQAPVVDGVAETGCVARQGRVKRESTRGRTGQPKVAISDCSVRKDSCSFLIWSRISMISNRSAGSRGLVGAVVAAGGESDSARSQCGPEDSTTSQILPAPHLRLDGWPATSRGPVTGWHLRAGRLSSSPSCSKHYRRARWTETMMAAVAQ
jgi:hypothetical protein